MKRASNRLKKRFTIWYVERGYTYSYQYDPDLGFPHMVGKFKCPFWVKPLTFLFSPSVYFAMSARRYILEGLVLGDGGSRKKFRKSWKAIVKRDLDA